MQTMPSATSLCLAALVAVGFGPHSALALPNPDPAPVPAPTPAPDPSPKPAEAGSVTLPGGIVLSFSITVPLPSVSHSHSHFYTAKATTATHVVKKFLLSSERGPRMDGHSHRDRTDEAVRHAAPHTPHHHIPDIPPEVQEHYNENKHDYRKYDKDFTKEASTSSRSRGRGYSQPDVQPHDVQPHDVRPKRPWRRPKEARPVEYEPSSLTGEGDGYDTWGPEPSKTSWGSDSNSDSGTWGHSGWGSGGYGGGNGNDGGGSGNGYGGNGYGNKGQGYHEVDHIHHKVSTKEDGSTTITGSHTASETHTVSHELTGTIVDIYNKLKKCYHKIYDKHQQHHGNSHSHSHVVIADESDMPVQTAVTASSGAAATSVLANPVIPSTNPLPIPPPLPPSPLFNLTPPLPPTSNTTTAVIPLTRSLRFVGLPMPTTAQRAEQPTGQPVI